MKKSFDLNIGTRKITVTPGENAVFNNGEITGTYKLSEGNAQKGIISFDNKTWENKDTGDLSYIELEAIAEAIPVQYEP